MPRRRKTPEPWERPLASRRERLEFVVAFAQCDLGNLTPEASNALQGGLAETVWCSLAPDPKRLQGDLMGVPPVSTAGRRDWRQRAAQSNGLDLRPYPAVYAAMSSGFPLPYDALCALQAETLRVLRAIAQGDDDSRSIPMEWIAWEQIQSCLAPRDIYVPAVRRRTLYVQGSLHHVFLYMLQFMLLIEPVDRILTCPECTRLFYRVTRQKYCSPHCTNAVALRAYRSDPAKRAAEAERAHQRYVKRKTPADRQAPLVVERRRRRQSRINITGEEIRHGEKSK